MSTRYHEVALQIFTRNWAVIIVKRMETAINENAGSVAEVARTLNAAENRRQVFRKTHGGADPLVSLATRRQ